MSLLPAEDILYVGDTARVPYGSKSPVTIARYAREIVTFLISQQVKLLVVACNSMSAVAISAIRALTDLPVLDVINAGVEGALRATRNGRIGIIGTPATIESNAYVNALRELNSEIQVFSRSCPLLVPLVEEGRWEGPVTRLVAREYLEPLQQARTDTIILGCTHYPLLKPLLQDIVGPDVTLIDSAAAVAAKTRDLLSALRLLRDGNQAGRGNFFVTDSPEHFRLQGEAFLNRKLTQLQLITLKGD
jgi:glutamate racemase